MHAMILSAARTHFPGGRSARADPKPRVSPPTQACLWRAPDRHTPDGPRTAGTEIAANPGTRDRPKHAEVTNDELASDYELAPEQFVLLEPEELETIEVAR
jgi:hypothetical protein